MLLSPGKNGLTFLFEEVRVFKETQGSLNSLQLNSFRGSEKGSASNRIQQTKFPDCLPPSPRGGMGKRV